MSHYRGGEFLSLLLKGGMSEFRKRMKIINIELSKIECTFSTSKVKATYGKKYGYSYKIQFIELSLVEVVHLV